MPLSHAEEIFKAGVSSVQAKNLITGSIRLKDDVLFLAENQIPLSSIKNLYVIGAGKASAAMALETEKILGDLITEGFIVTKYGHGLNFNKIESVEAGHPLPDENGVGAAKKIKQLAEKAGERDIIINLVSGGASALLADTPEGLSLESVQGLYHQLMQKGAAIHELNIVRKHLSYLKGGRLSRISLPASIHSFILSDVIGDDLSVIASGPTVPDPSNFRDAWNILKLYGLTTEVSPEIRTHFLKGLKGEIEDTPNQDDKIFEKTFNYLVGSNRIALEAASAKAKELGYSVSIITDRINGEAPDAANEFVKALLEYKGPKPACLLMGGETTVTVKGKGVGGRNQEFALAALCALKEIESSNKEGITVLSAGTDGTDGPTEATGAIINADTLKKANELNIDPAEFLLNNDSYHFFQKVGGHIITGPTQTNVMDIVIGMIE